MSWIGPCWLLKIVPWYFLKGKTPHLCTKNLIRPTQLLHLYHPPTCLIEENQCSRKVYNIEWVLRWRFSAYHCEPNVQHARCTYHKWNWEIFQLAAHNNHPHSNNRGTNCHTWKKYISYWVGTEKVVGMLFMGAKRISMHSLTNVKWVSSSAGCT